MVRLKLIWFALTAPRLAIEKRVDEVQSGYDWAYAHDIKQELEALNVGTWELVGVSIAHNGNTDTTEIHDFLKRAPRVINRLITRGNADDEIWWKYK